MLMSSRGRTSGEKGERFQSKSSRVSLLKVKMNGKSFCFGFVTMISSMRAGPKSVVDL